jgi:hypothetical protein
MAKFSTPRSGFVSVMVAVGCALIGSACSRPTDQGASRESVSPDSGKASYSTPERKPGYWRQSNLVEGAGGPVELKICIDKALDGRLSWWGTATRDSCGKNTFERESDGSWRFESDCRSNGVRTQRSGAVVGDFERAYQVQAVMTVSGSPVAGLNGTRRISIDADRIGDCPVDMKPGDVETATGARFNLDEMLRSAGQ